MKVCFDTSVLVAALLQQHPHHAIAFPRLKEVHDGKVEGHLTTHGLAELFATLTALPLRPRLLPGDAQRIIGNSVLGHFTIIPLGVKDYQDAIDLAVTRNLSSGAIYDALHIAGARSVGCVTLYTLNRRHFEGLAPRHSLISGP